jgi:hypothetical protein
VVSIASVRHLNPALVSFLNPFHNHQHITERARKSAKTPDDQYIALPQLVQQAVQLGPVPSPVPFAGRYPFWNASFSDIYSPRLVLP